MPSVEVSVNCQMCGSTIQKTVRVTKTQKVMVMCPSCMVPTQAIAKVTTTQTTTATPIGGVTTTSFDSSISGVPHHYGGFQPIYQTQDICQTCFKGCSGTKRDGHGEIQCTRCWDHKLCSPCFAGCKHQRQAQQKAQQAQHQAWQMNQHLGPPGVQYSFKFAGPNPSPFGGFGW